MADWKLQNRREFIRSVFGAYAGFAALPILGSEQWLSLKETQVLTILYTNDQHSRIEPFPGNDSKHPGEAGFSKRAELIEKIRQEGNHVLLLDAGDVFQGTPYFNFFKGELEYKLMSAMGYDATTFGNHDFDLGTENLVKQMPHANFRFICCNYRFSDSSLAGHEKIKPFMVFTKGDLKIGVTGVGIDLQGLVSKSNSAGIVYKDPIKTANLYASMLKNDEKCDYVICLSHLGYKYDFEKVSDCQLAKLSEHIDLIIGGHTHTFLNEPVTILNKLNKPVLVTQVGWAGIWLGRIDLYFGLRKRNLLEKSQVCKIN